MGSNRQSTRKVYFEVTNHCNFRCDFCPLGVSKRERRHMDFSLFQKGIDDIVGEQVADAVGFHVLGEPLLYPRIFDAVSYASDRGLRTEINTNGSLLTEDRVEKLAQAGLDLLSISVQILDEQEHPCRGSAVPFDQYYQMAMDTVRLVRNGDGTTEVVLCAMNTSTSKYFDIDTPMRLNGQSGAFKERLVPFFFDILSVVGRQVPYTHVEAAVHRLNVNHPTMVCVDERVKVYVQPLADWGNAFTSRKVYPAKIGFCGYALSNVGVLNNGEVTICCADYDGKTSLGNLHAESLAALLSSEQARAIEEGFDRNRIVHPYCQRCIGSPNQLKAVVKGLISIYLFKLLEFQPAGRIKEVVLVPASG